MNRYQCDVTVTDELQVYTTNSEHPVIDHLAMVMVDARGQKISVLLTRSQAIELGNQVQDFIINGHKEI